jgi:hypothetical protein
MTNDEREALEWLQGLPVSNPGTKVVDHVTTILLMLAARDPVAAMIARNLNRPAAIHVDEADKGIQSIPPRDRSRPRDQQKHRIRRHPGASP